MGEAELSADLPGTSADLLVVQPPANRVTVGQGEAGIGPGRRLDRLAEAAACNSRRPITATSMADTMAAS